MPTLTKTTKLKPDDIGSAAFQQLLLTKICKSLQTFETKLVRLVADQVRSFQRDVSCSIAATSSIATTTPPMATETATAEASTARAEASQQQRQCTTMASLCNLTCQLDLKISLQRKSFGKLLRIYCSSSCCCRHQCCRSCCCCCCSPTLKTFIQY